MENPLHFIITDDDATDSFITRRIISKEFPEANISIFTAAQDLLNFIKSPDNDSENRRIVVFLDIIMQGISGWEFMEQFDKLDDARKKGITIYVLTNSERDEDRRKAVNDKYIEGYIVKPLTGQSLKNIMDA